MQTDNFLESTMVQPIEYAKSDIHRNLHATTHAEGAEWKSTPADITERQALIRGL